MVVRLRLASRGQPPGVSRTTPWREARWCAVDLELTGLDPRRDHVIAIGAVPIEQGRVILGSSLYTLVRTSRRSEPGAVLAHQLRLADLEDAPGIDDAMAMLVERLAGCVPVFHFAAIERTFLAPLLAARGSKLGDAADTEVLGRIWLTHRGERSPSRLQLPRLSELLGQRAEGSHHALADAVSTAQAFIALATHLDELEQPQSVGTLARAHERFAGARRFGPA